LLALLLISSLALQICVDFIPSLLSLTKNQPTPYKNPQKFHHKKSHTSIEKL